MKSKHLYIISICIVIGIVVAISGCAARANSIYGSDQAVFETITFSHETLLETSVDDKQPEPVAVLFLIDISGSIVGEGDGVNNCGKDIPDNNLPHNGAYYILNILESLPTAYSQNIHVGVGQFGESYSQIINWTSADKLKYTNNISKLTENFSYKDKSTNYTSALEKGYQSLKTYSNNKNISRKIIFIVTDGIDVNGDATEKILADIPLDVQIYVNLVCPNTKGDTSFWAKHRISTSKFPDEWLTGFWNIPDVKQALPPKSGWVHEKTEREIFIDGSVSEVKFRYFTWGDPEHSNFEVDGVRIDQKSSPIPKTPEQGCVNHKFSLSSRSTDIGFWWVETETPKIDNISIDSDENVTNNSVVNITAHLFSDDFSSGEMEKWRDCYSDFTFDFIAPDGQKIEDVLLRPMPCEDGGTGLCPERGKDGLFRTWQWLPPVLKNAGNVQVSVTFNYENAFRISSEESNFIMFTFRPKPAMNAVSYDYQASSSERAFVDFHFDFDMNQVRPNIHLLKTKAQEASLEDGSCPSSDTEDIPSKILFPGYFVQQDSPKNNLQAEVLTFPTERGKYRLSIDRIVIDECGFTKILFHWKTESRYHIEDSVWTCDLSSFICKEE